MDSSQPTQKATQQVEDPRRLGKNLSNISDNDATDVICLLHPNSPAAFEAIKANLIPSPQHILQNSDLEGIDEEDLLFNEEFRSPRDVALRMSSKVKSPKDGFRFGRYGSVCDILLTPAPDDNLVSKIHFKIFVNSQGSLMLQDLSTNGTVVDGVHLTTRAKGGKTMSKPATTVLKNGSIICVVAGSLKSEVKFMIRIPHRGDGEDLYEENLRKYLSARGAVANFASMRESSYGNHWNGGSLYNFTGLLGKGAFATVYRIQTKKEGDIYAAKELDKRRFIKNGILDIKFDSELNIMKTLSHPNIVNYVDCQEYQHWIYILMEYVPFGELSQEMRRLGKIPEPDVQQITRQMMHALSYLHRRNITHRDIKPDNILIASRSPLIVKLSDFGLSKCVKDQETFLKTFCGTLLYCAPEVYPDYIAYTQGSTTKRRRLGEPAVKQAPSPYDQSVDMWSFGAVIFHMLCGKPPITGRGDDRGAQMLSNIMTKEVDFDPLREANVSEDAIDFIAKLLNRNPALRPKESECFHHPWLRHVQDHFEYEDDELVFHPQERELGILEEVEEDLLDDELIANLQQLTQQPAPPQTPDRPAKRPRRASSQQPAAVSSNEAFMREVPYPALPNLGETFAPLAGAPQPNLGERLFGEVTPSILRSSGVFGAELCPNPSADVPDIRGGVEQISVNDFVIRDNNAGSESADNCGQPLQYPQALVIPRAYSGSAASLMGAEQQIGQLNMASPEGEHSDAATSEVTNPITPQTRELSPWTAPNQVADTKMEDTRSSSEEPVFNRHIDLDLVNDPDQFAAELEARDASRAGKVRAKAETFHGNANSKVRVASVELATTIDAKTGNPVDYEGPFHVTPRQGGAQFIKPAKRFGRLTSVCGSFADVTINLEDRLVHWGRGIDCTIPYTDKKDTRIPKYAMKITFWAPGIEQYTENGGDWTQYAGVKTLISTSASKCIWVNDVELRKESVDGEAALFGTLYTGDIVTICDNHQGEFLKFSVEITFGDSARRRPESEKGFVIQQERLFHQRVMKNRESIRASRIETDQAA